MSWLYMAAQPWAAAAAQQPCSSRATQTIQASRLLRRRLARSSTDDDAATATARHTPTAVEPPTHHEGGQRCEGSGGGRHVRDQRVRGDVAEAKEVTPKHLSYMYACGRGEIGFTPSTHQGRDSEPLPGAAPPRQRTRDATSNHCQERLHPVNPPGTRPQTTARSGGTTAA